MSDIDPLKRLGMYARDLLGVSESIISLGRLNKYDDQQQNEIVVDNLSPANQKSVTKTYDGQNEVMGIDTLWLGQFTLNFYGADAYTNASTFLVLNNTEEARTLQKTHQISVFRTSQITNLKRLAGTNYDSRYEITLNASYNTTIPVNRLCFEELQLGDILVDK